MKKIDMVLVQCEIDSAPTVADYKLALEMLMEGSPDGEQLQLEPVQYSENNTFAGGFITESASESVDYLVREDDPLGLKIREILGDKDKEIVQGMYDIEGLRVAIIYSSLYNKDNG